MTANLVTLWSTLLLQSLADAGVRDVVLSPGSRSTPFMVAATREPRLRCHDSIDERAAAFFALGQARVTGRPTVLICTSGSAPAHYYPAVIEASLAHVPLIALTADRPLELQDCGAPQAIDQVKLFGGYVRKYIELGTPDASPQALRGLRRMAAQAVFTAAGPSPGPVQINARARKPLEPRPASTPEEHALEALVNRIAAEPIVVAQVAASLPAPASLAAVARLLRDSRRGLIVCGPAPLFQRELREPLQALAAALGHPLLCEAPSQLRFGVTETSDVVWCDAFDTFLRSPHFRATQSPETILQLGAPPTSGPWEIYTAAHPETTRVVVASNGWNDPTNNARVMLFGGVLDTVRGLLDAVRATSRSSVTSSAANTPTAANAPTAPTAPDATDATTAPDATDATTATTATTATDATAATGASSEWSDTFAKVNAIAWSVVDAALEDVSSLSEGHVARLVGKSLQAGSLFMVGNSLAIREIDTFCRSTDIDVGVLSQRGANGIDGLIAGALGAASVGSRPLTLLLGDVSFLHDLSSLLLARDLSICVTIVVTQNGGGRIFEQLPLATTPGIDASVMNHFTTPHAVDLEHAARLFALPFTRVTTPNALAEALAAAKRRVGCGVIEAVVPPHGAYELHGRIWHKTAALVDAMLSHGP